MKKVVIIGGVAGGASCAARLRRLDETAEITLLERGYNISYANCGLPYHVGGVIPARQSLLLQTPEAMKKKFRVDVRVRSEAVSIDRAARTVAVRNLETGEEYSLPYDTLVLATGSSPVRPPIPGIDSPRVQTLWTVEDAVRIRALVSEAHLKSAVVVGGGFIGLEMAENLRRAGLAVTIVEMLDQVMAPLDFEMAQLLHEQLEQNGVRLHLGDGVSSFTDGAQGGHGRAQERRDRLGRARHPLHRREAQQRARPGRRTRGQRARRRGQRLASHLRPQHLRGRRRH
jgi:NADPH-dependent 2,4-dienoyl-CoA reductase/sulfur reductase-like enzyme